MIMLTLERSATATFKIFVNQETKVSKNRASHVQIDKKTIIEKKNCL